MINQDNGSLLEQLESLMVAFNSAYDGLHILDKDGYTLMINSACERIEGISAEAIGNKNVRQLVEEGYFSESVTLKVLEKKAPVTLIQKVRNGNEVLVTGVPVYKDGAIDKVVVSSRDITELNQLKSEISERTLLLEKYHEEWQKLHARITLTGDIVCNSDAMRKVIDTAIISAKVESTILITGESGTGKGVISKFIHDNSTRKEKPYVKIDCGSIPELLFESEIFGYERGSFTGADNKGKMGLAQIADKGTLFLDEIGEVPLSMQVKLLRLVQDKEILRVGGKNPIKINLRIIAATNKDLSKMVKEGKFREDLYYRLNVIPIEIPPLRERRDDISKIALNLIAKLNDKYATNKKISMKTMEKLIDYTWPGNVRELENIIERIMILTEKSVIEIEDLPQAIRKVERNIAINSNTYLKKMTEQFEKDILEKLLSDKLSVAQISELLQIDVTTVRRKLHKYSLAK